MPNMTEPYAYIRSQLEDLQCEEDMCRMEVLKLTARAETFQTSRIRLQHALDKQIEEDSDTQED